jgi:hypothetical protein
MTNHIPKKPNKRKTRKFKGGDFKRMKRMDGNATRNEIPIEPSGIASQNAFVW